MRRWGFVIVLLAVSVMAGGVSSAGVAASSSGAIPSVAGAWTVKVAGNCCTGTVTYTFTKTGPSTYSINNESGFNSSGVVLSGSASSATMTSYWCNGAASVSPECEAAKLPGTFKVVLMFNLSKCPQTFAGNFSQPFNTTGAYSGTENGTRACRKRKRRKQVVLSGGVFEHVCAPYSAKCDVVVVPVEGRAVSVTGARGRADTVTAKNGKWTVKVKRGSYTISVPGPAASVDPMSRSINAQVDVGHLNSLSASSPQATRARSFRAGWSRSMVASSISSTSPTRTRGSACPTTPSPPVHLADSARLRSRAR